ncbi:MAG: hypothetical protein ACE5OZ_03190 [Candidatus Heimdallarchaeota archaeon]
MSEMNKPFFSSVSEILNILSDWVLLTFAIGLIIGIFESDVFALDSFWMLICSLLLWVSFEALRFYSLKTQRKRLELLSAPTSENGSSN